MPFIEDDPQAPTLKEIEISMERDGYLSLPAGTVVNIEIQERKSSIPLVQGTEFGITSEGSIINPNLVNVYAIKDATLPEDTMFGSIVSYKPEDKRVGLFVTSNDLLKLEKRYLGWKKDLIKKGRLVVWKDDSGIYEDFVSGSEEEKENKRFNEEMNGLLEVANKGFLKKMEYSLPMEELIQSVRIYINVKE